MYNLLNEALKNREPEIIISEQSDITVIDYEEDEIYDENEYNIVKKKEQKTKVGTLKKIIETTETETNIQPSVSFPLPGCWSLFRCYSTSACRARMASNVQLVFFVSYPFLPKSAGISPHFLVSHFSMGVVMLCVRSQFSPRAMI